MDVITMKKFVAEDAGRSNDSYSWEFLKIRVECEDMKDLPGFSISVGVGPENVSKNRYKDIVPFDYSRVKLSTESDDDEDLTRDYINASFINGANGKVAYIAAQGPVAETVDDFWKMVIDYSVQVIVMLCNVVEQGRKKCEKYWPEKDEVLYFGCVRVSLIGEDKDHSEILIRHLKVEIPVSSETRPIVTVVHQIHYCGWPDHGLPENIQSLIDIVEIMRKYQPKDRHPLLIHCSAGCGRTGTICGIDYVRSMIKTGTIKEEFSVAEIVTEMRRQRPAMVQTPEQYILLHRIVRELFQQQLNMVEDHDYENLSPIDKKTSAKPLSFPLPEKSSIEGSEPSHPPVPPRRSKAFLKKVDLEEIEDALHKPSVPLAQLQKDEGTSKPKKIYPNGGRYTTDKTKWVNTAGVSIPDYPYWPLEKPSGPRDMPSSFEKKF